MSKTFVGTIKTILSGDSFVVASLQNPSAERVFSLAYVTAPHLRREGGDDPFAFEAREWLRTSALGKTVQCTVLYTVPTSKRDFGTALVKNGPQLPEDGVKAGYLQVREDAGRKDDDEALQALIANLREQEGYARTEEKGVWNPDAENGGAIDVDYDIPASSSAAFLSQWKGKEVDGVVERIFSADRLLIRAKLTPTQHLQTIVLVAGIRAPASDRTNPSTGEVQQAGEPFGQEAKQFVEKRLTQRGIKITVLGFSPQGQLIATVMHPRGNIAEFLLQEGLARCNDFHSTLLGASMRSLREAERLAQGKKLRLHQNFVGKASDATSVSEVTVSKVISGDMIVVRSKATSAEGNATEKRISFSSVRGPRTTEPTEAPFREDAKEFLRKRLIGKQVQISVDGKKPASDGFEAREVATVVEKGVNIGLLLVQEGWATVIRHRKDDTDRAPNYDELLAAQEEAKEAKKGMFSGKGPRVKQYQDMSESVQKAKIQLGSLQRQRKIPVVVDFCRSGSRFTVLIPRETAKITLVLGGIRAPRAPRPPNDKGEPFGQEALDLANRRCQQRDAEINVFDVDKTGGFIGELLIHRENFAKILVEEGLASVHEYSAEKLGLAPEFLAAQQRAKEARRGQWHDWDPSQEVEEEEVEGEAEAGTSVNGGNAGSRGASTGTASWGQNKKTAGAVDGTVTQRSTDYREVIITNVDGNGHIKVQEVGTGTHALERLMTEFKRFHLQPQSKNGLPQAPKVGDLVAAKFTADGQWYRARIRANDRTAKRAEVMFIDYGNSESHAWSDLRPLDQAHFNTQALKPQATDVSLSFVQLPVGADYYQDAVALLNELTEGKRVIALFDHVGGDAKSPGGGGENSVTLFASAKDAAALPGPLESVNRDLVRNGLAMVARKLRSWERSAVFTPQLENLREVEQEAKEARIGMWEYGDLTGDE